YYRHMRHLFDSRTRQICDLQLQKKGGLPFHVHLESTVVSDKSGDSTQCRTVVMDITQRFETEKRLKAAYEIIQQSPAVVFLWKNTEGWPVEFVSENVMALLGYSADDFMLGNLLYTTVVHPDDLARVAGEVAYFSRDKDRKRFIHPPYRIVTRSGKIKWISDRTDICRDEKGKITHYQGIVLDITIRNKAEKALKEQTDFLNALLETISSPIFYKDTKGRYTGCNRAFENLTGRLRSYIIGKTVYDMEPRKIADRYHQKDVALFEKQDKQRYEGKLKRTNGEVRDVIFDKACLHDTTGAVTGLVGVISDITERKHAEDLVRDLSQRLMQAQERERQMISCELHDSIAQNLSTLKLYCSRLFNALSSSESDIKELSAGTSRLLDQTITAVRDLAYNLRPPSLEHMGLVAALDVFCEEFAEKNDIRVDFQAAGIHESKLTPDAQINLYRLVMEGLNNIRKHAAADKATIRLVGAYPNVILRIEDNGKGFDVKERERSIVNEKRMGLRSMRERANLLKGQMSIHSQLNKGTQIVIKLPLRDKAKWIKKSEF
ncbi:MAG: PAS domain S-box protein, partial [Desulfobacula sp.]|nr:PAS domain S-box protein [Desulfobacula sp.]